VGKRLAAVASVLLTAVVVAGCGGPSGPDPYEQLTAATKVAFDPIQVNVGLIATDGSTTFTIEPTAIGIVVDAAGQRSGVHVALPTAGMGLDAFALDALGIDGDTIDFDLVYAGEKLYIRSALLGASLRMILGPSGKVPAGDLAGWLGFGSAEEFAALSGLLGAAPAPSAAPPSAGNAQSLRLALEGAGITLTSAGTEAHDGADAIHLRVAVDSAKLLASPYFDAATRAQLGRIGVSLPSLAIGGDLWIAAAANRVVEADIHVASTTQPDQTADLRVTFRAPDATVSLDAPPSFVDVPLRTLVTEMLKLLGKGAES
jgi:hypothetical protein